MEFWISFWTAVLVISLAIFAILSIVVAIGAFFDIRFLFKSLDGQSKQPGESAD